MLTCSKNCPLTVLLQGTMMVDFENYIVNDSERFSYKPFFSLPLFIIIFIMVPWHIDVGCYSDISDQTASYPCHVNQFYWRLVLYLVPVHYTRLSVDVHWLVFPLTKPVIIKFSNPSFRMSTCLFTISLRSILRDN